MYVYNFPEGGFIVISGIKDTDPVLAYNTTGSFDINSIISGLDDWKNRFIYISENPGCIHPDSAAVSRTVWREFEKANPIATCISRDMKPGDLDPEVHQQLQKIYGDSLSSWNAKNYTYYNLDKFKKEYPELYDHYNDMARSLIWPEYEIAYEKYAYIVVRHEAVENERRKFMHTKWEQINGFNMAFGPEGTNLDHAYVGCGPVAIGQIMYYYRKPISYNWDDMPLESANMTVSLFLYDVAKAAKVKFTDTATEITAGGYKSAFSKFNYHYKVDGYNYNKVISELNSGRPVILRGYNKESGNGHAYVACGVSTSYYATSLELWTFPDVNRFRSVNTEIIHVSNVTWFYVNWGWNGDCDGYYRDLNPMTNGHGTYILGDMVYEIYPNN